MGRGKAEVEYKETVIFELFPKFSYTPLQRKRVVLFHGWGKNARKLIRYAANFDEPNKICLVYLVGEIKAGLIERTLDECDCSDRVCVLTAEFPKEQVGIWEEYEENVRKTHRGMWDKEKDEPAAWVLEEKRKLINYYADSMVGGMDGQIGLFGAGEDYDNCVKRIEEYEAFFARIERYRKLRDKCGTVYFKHFRLHRRGCLEKPYTHERLDELIKRIFPLGAEAMGASVYASISPAAIGKAFEWARGGETDKRLGLTDAIIAPAEKALVELITHSINERGYCSLAEMRSTMANPPFGLGNDGFSAAVFARALRHFGNRTMIFYDSCGHHRLKGSEPAVFDLLFGARSKARARRYENACVYLESQPHKKVKQFMAKLWGIKIEMPGALMGLHLGQDLCRTHRVPLAYVDTRLLHLTMWDLDFWDKAQVAAVANEIAEHGTDILAAYERYRQENSHIPANAQSLMTADYSWAWTAEEYDRILWQTEKYGPWPWDNETHQEAKEAYKRMRKEQHGESAL